MTDFVEQMRRPLSSGSHKADSGEQCVMERVSILWALATGQDVTKVFSDLPECTNPVVARAAQVVNDRMTDEGRQRLSALIPRLLRARRTEADRRVDVRLALWCLRRVQHLTEGEGRVASEACERAIEDWLANPCEETAATAANAAANAANAAANTANAANAAAYAAYAAANAANAADAYAVNAARAAGAHGARLADLRDARAVAWAADSPDDALVAFLDGLLDAWEEAVTKEGQDPSIPREWEDEALAFVAEMTS